MPTKKKPKYITPALKKEIEKGRRQIKEGKSYPLAEVMAAASTQTPLRKIKP
jgi:hypothetical protein